MNNYIGYAPEYIWGLGACFALSAIVRSPVLFGVASALSASVLYFFRGPVVPIKEPNERVLYSPCEGTVMFATPRHVAVFLSPLNLHVQVFPASGTIESVVHKEGEFNAAYLFEKSQFNERVETVLATTHVGRVRIVQYAGQLARRIVSFFKAGETAKSLQPMGLIKLGSRVDLILEDPDSPLRTVVLTGQKLRMGDILFA